MFSYVKKKLYSIYTKGYLHYSIILTLDVFVGVFSACIATVATLYFTGAHTDHLALLILIALGAAALSSFVSALVLKSYKQILRYSSFSVSQKTVRKAFVNAVLLTLLSDLFINLSPIDVSLRRFALFGVLFFMFDFFFTVGSRGFIILVTRWLKRGMNPNPEIVKDRVLIFGVSNDSVNTAKLLEDNKEFEAVGFCTRSDEKTKYEIGGLQIYHIKDIYKFSLLAKHKKIHGIVFTGERDFLKEREAFLVDCQSIGLKTYLAPKIGEASADNVARNGVRSIRIEDLLLRDVIHHEKKVVQDMYRDKVVMVTGAAGSIGSELVDQIAALNVRQLVLVDNAETPLHNIRLKIEDKYKSLKFAPIIGDVRNKNRLKAIFETYRPDIVIHAAAYKHVPLMEENPCESIRVNVIGSKNVADLCRQYNVDRMVMVSTDKAVNPTNVMGASKRAAEIYIQSLGKAIENGSLEGRTKYITTRFGNVLGSQGSVIHRFREQIEKGGPVTVTDERIVRFFMSIPEACSLVLVASASATATQIFVFDMGEQHKIVDLAKRMIKLSGLEPDVDIKIKFTGLRPGEKLYEETLATEENTYPTEIEKVMIARVREFAMEEIADQYKELETLSEGVRVLESVKLLKQLVPEFKSANSRFVVLDQDTSQQNDA